MMKEKPLSFEAWQETLHSSIRNDPLWTLTVYQRAMFMFDLSWHDCEHLLRERRGRAVADQLLRSVGAIAANIEEGYGRGSEKDYHYRLRIALGEAREAKGWYWRGRNILPATVLDHRLSQLTEIIAMLRTLTYQTRTRKNE